MDEVNDSTNKKSSLTTAKEGIFYLLGIILICGFFLLYVTRFFNIHAVPPLIHEIYYEWGSNGLIAINAGVFILFLLFIPYRAKIEWRSKGIFSAFILALMAEMFGVNLLFYLLSPILGYTSLEINIPGLGSLHLTRHFFILGWPGVVIGAWMTLIGMGLVFAAWRKIHKSKTLVTTGLYKYVRHPQYTGLSLIVIGWIFHWTSVLIIVMGILLLMLYYRLARQEEKELFQQYKDEYKVYYEDTPIFLPIKRKK